MKYTILNEKGVKVTETTSIVAARDVLAGLAGGQITTGVRAPKVVESKTPRYTLAGLLGETQYGGERHCRSLYGITVACEITQAEFQKIEGLEHLLAQNACDVLAPFDCTPDDRAERVGGRGYFGDMFSNNYDSARTKGNVDSIDAQRIAGFNGCGFEKLFKSSEKHHKNERFIMTAVFDPAKVAAAAKTPAMPILQAAANAGLDLHARAEKETGCEYFIRMCVESMQKTDAEKENNPEYDRVFYTDYPGDRAGLESELKSSGFDTREMVTYGWAGGGWLVWIKYEDGVRHSMGNRDGYEDLYQFMREYHWTFQSRKIKLNA